MNHPSVTKLTSSASAASVASGVAPSTVSSLSTANATPSSAVEFPFIFMHIELVKYFREREMELAKQKEEWAERVKRSDFAEFLNGGVEAMGLSERIFAAGNAETRLEAIGYRIGHTLAERLAKNAPRISSELEAMKFICKELWVSAFGKGVDNLEIYIIQDNRFPTITAFSEGDLQEALIFLALPSGVVRGALASLGISSIVSAKVDVVPVVQFTIHLQK